MLQILAKLSVSGLQLLGVEPCKHHLGASDGFFQTTFEIHKHSVYLLWLKSLKILQQVYSFQQHCTIWITIHNNINNKFSMLYFYTFERQVISPFYFCDFSNVHWTSTQINKCTKNVHLLIMKRIFETTGLVISP